MAYTNLYYSTSGFASAFLSFTLDASLDLFYHEMPFKDITNDFRQAVREKETSIPDAKRRKVARSSRTGDEGNSIEKTFVAEAQNIVCASVDYEHPASLIMAITLHS